MAAAKALQFHLRPFTQAMLRALLLLLLGALLLGQGHAARPLAQQLAQALLTGKIRPAAEAMALALGVRAAAQQSGHAAPPPLPALRCPRLPAAARVQGCTHTHTAADASQPARSGRWRPVHRF